MKTRIFKSLCVLLILGAVIHNSTIYSMATSGEATSSDAKSDNSSDDSTSDTDIEALQQSIQEKQSELQKLQNEKTTIQSNKTSAEAVIKVLRPVSRRSTVILLKWMQNLQPFSLILTTLMIR